MLAMMTMLAALWPCRSASLYCVQILIIVMQTRQITRQEIMHLMGCADLDASVIMTWTESDSCCLSSGFANCGTVYWSIPQVMMAEASTQFLVT